MIHRFRYIGSVVILFLGCVLSVVGSAIYAQSANDSIKLSDNVEVRQLADGVWLHSTYFDIEGFENIPAAFQGLFSGDNIGKQLVRV